MNDLRKNFQPSSTRSKQELVRLAASRDRDHPACDAGAARSGSRGRRVRDHRRRRDRRADRSTSRSAASRCSRCRHRSRSTCATWSRRCGCRRRSSGRPTSSSTSARRRDGSTATTSTRSCAGSSPRWASRRGSSTARRSTPTSRLDAAKAGAIDDMDSYLDGLQRQFVQAIFESHAAGNIDLQVAVQLAVVGPVLRADRRPCREHRRAGPLPRHRLDARALRRRALPGPRRGGPRHRPTCRWPDGLPEPRPGLTGRHAGRPPDHRTGGAAPSCGALATAPDPRAAPATRRSSAIRPRCRSSSSAELARLRVALDALPDRGRAGGRRRQRSLFRNSVSEHIAGSRHADVLVEEAVDALIAEAIVGTRAAARRSSCSARRGARCRPARPTRSTVVRVVRW